MLARLVGALAALILLVILASVSAITQKSMLAWPVLAPTQVRADTPGYAAAGWTVSSPFGWRGDPDQPGSFELHDGIDLDGPMFCPGCAIPPLGDVVVAAVGWNRAEAPDPLLAGAGVVVDMHLQHPEEAGTVTIRYGHLQPYRVHVRTRSCTRGVTCPRYALDPAASVRITCAGTLVPTARGRGTASFAYTTPGMCRASVTWPRAYQPRGATTITFDQQIVPGVASSDAAITFNAERLPPPTPTSVTVVSARP